jgi:arylsulfatase A-like enzyme
VLFVFSDEHRWQSMSMTEMPGMHTPNMARLAREGLSCSNAISNYPVCSPHRAMLITGRWPYRQRMRDDSPGMIDNGYRLSPDQQSLGRAFRDAGYSTGYIGKWHLGDDDPRAEPFGFDHSIIWTHTNDHWNSVCHPKDGRQEVRGVYNATGMTDQALEFLSGQDDDPFMLALSINPPHSRFTDAPEDMIELYPNPSDLPRRRNVEIDDRKAFWRQYQGYHAHISAVDRELGRLLDLLDRRGLAEDTIVIYTSDHGSMFQSHGVGSKRQPHEESIKVPFIIRWPGRVPAGAGTSRLFGTIDIMPTLCALAGVEIPGGCDGQDFSGVLMGGTGPDPASQFIMHISKLNSSWGNDHPAPRFRGVTTGAHTYAHSREVPSMLFDNQADPYQMVNRYGDASLAATQDELAEMTEAWLSRAEDPYGGCD